MIEATWAPKPVEDVKKKLVDLKLNPKFKESLLDEVSRIYGEPQSRMQSFE
jgi:hypothetical protein